MSKIDEKYEALKRDGLDLGAPLAPEEDAGYGGRVRWYQNGNIYYHAVMGEAAREVHGGILTSYLAQGGPGPHPTTQRRHLGFPLFDESNALGWGARVSHFEWGAIWWVPGRGAVTLHGQVYQQYKLATQHYYLGHPLTDNLPVAGGEAAYFQRGCVWATTAVANSGLVGIIDPPLLGRAAVLDVSNPEHRVFPRLVRFPDVDETRYTALTRWRPSVFADIWNMRLSLSPVLPPGAVRTPLPLRATQHPRSSPTQVGVRLEVLPTVPVQIAERTLYDFNVNLPNGRAFAISPHCFYAARDWRNFGVLHATDLHISRRNEQYRNRLYALNQVDPAANYANFQDNFRAFVTYANRLHALGLADAVIATGDLVDYVYENNNHNAGNNFLYFEQLIRGNTAEELRIPIYTVFGNHDYRLYPYELLAEVDLPLPDAISGTKEIAQHSSHNLKPDEARALQGGKALRISPERAVEMLRVDPNNQAGHYNYYRRHINDERNYIVNFGPHRIVMLDTGSDVGIPTGTDWGDILSLFWKEITDGYTEDELQAQSGAPNQGGVGVGTGLDPVRAALSGGDGVVIIGMHAPPFSPPGGEYPYYLRETQHPVADPREVPEFLRRRKGTSTGWINSGTPYFKTGLVGDGLDYGIPRSGIEEFVRLITGVGAQRPADLVLCGHQHDRVEYRLRWDAMRNELQYFMDFYTENPSVYYTNVLNFAIGETPAGERVRVRVSAGVPAQGRLTLTRDHRTGITRKYMDVPPYATPLNAAADVRTWWTNHRPLVMQTASLGPIDRRQRFDPRWRVTTKIKVGTSYDYLHVKTYESAQSPVQPAYNVTVESLPAQDPDVAFHGFRLIQVRDNVIARIRYVNLAELRQRGFVMPWETEFVTLPTMPVVNEFRV